MIFKYGEEKAKETLNNIKNSNKKIDWNDFNWPPFINIANFNIKHLDDEDQRKVISHYKVSNYCICIYFLINFINCIIQATVDYSSLRILCCLFGFFLFFSIKLHLYYNNYIHLLTKKVNSKIIILIEQIILWIFYFTFILFNYLCFNGLFRIRTFVKDKKKGLIVLIFIEIIPLIFVLFFEIKGFILKRKIQNN